MSVCLSICVCLIKTILLLLSLCTAVSQSVPVSADGITLDHKIVVVVVVHGQFQMGFH